MPKLPHPSAEKVIKLLTRNGFAIVGRKGSHIRLKKKDATGTFIVIVPYQGEIAPGTFHSIIRQSGMDKEEFVRGL
jgi:predicted RNA binding protein YcfA (HicA-like mRNA interferase family)